MDWERCGRSAGGGLTGWGRRDELWDRTTAGVEGAVADMATRLLFGVVWVVLLLLASGAQGAAEDPTTCDAPRALGKRGALGCGALVVADCGLLWRRGSAQADGRWARTRGQGRQRGTGGQWEREKERKSGVATR